MTFIYEPDLYSLEMYQETRNELSRSRFSQVILLQTYGHTDRQTDRHRER